MFFFNLKKKKNKQGCSPLRKQSQFWNSFMLHFIKVLQSQISESLQSFMQLQACICDSELVFSRQSLLRNKVVNTAGVTCQYLLLTQQQRTPGWEALKISNCIFLFTCRQLSQHWGTWPREAVLPVLPATSPTTRMTVQKGLNLAPAL